MNMSIDYNSLFSKINKFSCVVCSNITYTKEELILEICPVCYIEYKSQTDLNQSFHLEVSNPITRKVLPYCIVITDSFKELNPIDYSQTAILHVGVSNSKSEVYNFWSKYKIDNPNKEDLWKYVIYLYLALTLSRLIVY